MNRHKTEWIYTKNEWRLINENVSTENETIRVCAWLKYLTKSLQRQLPEILGSLSISAEK